MTGMAELSVAALLARTATHEANAWLLSIAAGAAAAFGVLFFVRCAPMEYRESVAPRERATLAALLALAIVGAALGAAVLPIAVRLPAALAARDARVLLAGDRMAIGALAGFAIAGGLAARRLRLDPMAALDRLAPSLGALVVLGRVGCFLEGCDFGAVTRAAWGVSYPAGSHAFEHQLAQGLVRATDATALPVYPAQLYEALAGVGMMIIAALVLRRTSSGIARSGAGGSRGGVGPSSWLAPGSSGLAFRASLVVYAAARFAIEPLRGDPRPFLGPLSMPQWLCVALVAWALGGLAGEARGAASKAE